MITELPCLLTKGRKDEPPSLKYNTVDPMQIFMRGKTTVPRHDQVVFDPSGSYKGKDFNLFRKLQIGLAECITDHANVQPWLDHIRVAWTQNQNEGNLYEFVVDWFAHILQKPHVQTEIAISLTGAQGGGKGCILKPIGCILGPNHYYQTTCGNDITGQFSDPDLLTCLLMFVDEASFSGDKSVAGLWKGLITELKRGLEVKY
jgi:hypothetical protein